MIEQITRRYRCWIVGQRVETEETVEDVSSFEARKVIARKHGVPTYDVAAQRVEDERGNQ